MVVPLTATKDGVSFPFQIHFRRDHFLCEDESCLAKKFVVFQSDSELKVRICWRDADYEWLQKEKHAYMQI